MAMLSKGLVSSRIMSRLIWHSQCDEKHLVSLLNVSFWRFMRRLLEKLTFQSRVLLSLDVVKWWSWSQFHIETVSMNTQLFCRNAWMVFHLLASLTQICECGIRRDFNAYRRPQGLVTQMKIPAADSSLCFFSSAFRQMCFSHQRRPLSSINY